MNFDDAVQYEELEIIPVQISDKVSILVEATSLGGEEDVGIGDVLKFEQVTDAIEAIATSLSETLKKVKPQKAVVEFGLEMGVESGQLTTLLVKGAGKGNLKITLEWSER